MCLGCIANLDLVRPETPYGLEGYRLRLDAGIDFPHHEDRRAHV